MKITEKHIVTLGSFVFIFMVFMASCKPAMNIIEFFSWNEKNVQRTIASGDTIVSALYAFQKETGSFPDSLDELVPAYLQKIPAPSVPRYKWEYRHFMSDGEYGSWAESEEEDKNTVDTFRLEVSCGEYRYPIIVYVSNMRYWHIDE